MSRSRIESFAESNERLRDDLLERCRRLRRGRSDAASDAAIGVPVGEARCWLTKERPDSDWPSLLEAERHAYALLEAVHEVAKLLGRLEPFRRGPGNGRRS